MRLSQVDLNLFIVFDTIYTERNLTRAADVLFITQPAVSNALNRLRNTFNDPLFVRTPQGMAPTPLAENIVGPVREALQLLTTSVQEADVFDPAVAEKTFNFSMNDEAEALLLPSLMELLQQQAPGVGVTSYHVGRGDLPTELASGKLDFAIDAPLITDANLRHARLLAAEYVCLVRPDHPGVGNRLTLDQYLALDHLHISSRPTGPGHVDLALNRLGHRRKVQVRVRHYLVAPLIALRTDMALTAPRRVAMESPLKILELPFDVPSLEWHVYWHKSADRDQANRWMRQLLLDLVHEKN